MKKLILLSCLLLCAITNYGQNIFLKDTDHYPKSNNFFIEHFSSPKYEVQIMKDTIYVYMDTMPVWKLAFRDTLFSIYENNLDTITKYGNRWDAEFKSKYSK